jgi:hypothetical protein
MWEELQNIMTDVGFVPGTSHRAATIDTGSHTYNQRVTDKLVKRDLVLNFRKAGHGDCPAKRPRARPTNDGFTELASRAIRDYLLANPGASKDRIYDHLVSFLVRTGQMQEHDFPGLLTRIARNEGDERSRWFLKD